MNRVPPNLLYLTIYNPTLRPTQPVDDDNEDAEEQAHILFYTSKERAVSRDRMLRQIGLAKALINFAELFNTDDPCNSVHSQSRRMIMVSPEPGFWIHACVEVARALKVEYAKGKSKSKNKPIDKGKEKDPSQLYEYEDGSVHDNALRAHILKGYEHFKLTHGSFTSILINLGQQALELQLERFFTVWAWSWDLEDGHFGESFGPLLHPYSSRLIPLLDEFSGKLSANIIPVVLTPPHAIPSTRYTDRRYPASLAMHLLGMVPPRRDPSSSLDAIDALNSSVDTLKARDTPGHNIGPEDSDANSTFLGMPAIDVRKWTWPGYLTFGRGNGSKRGSDQPAIPASEKEKPVAEEGLSHVEVEINESALEDAISSDSLSISRLLIHTEGQGEDQHQSPDGGDLPVGPQDFLSSPLSTTVSAPNIDGIPLLQPLLPPLPEFSMTRVHLAPLRSPISTTPVTIHYFIRNQVMLALLNNEGTAAESYDVEVDDLQAAAGGVLRLFDEVDSRIYDAGLESMSESLPSATKILQTQDQYIISTGQYTQISPGFSSKSSHLFNAMATLSSDSGITEVFSRGQNPQHWHIGKRGLKQAVGDGKESTNGDEAVFLEVFRKETSLTDVDNVLAGIVRK